MGRRRTAPPAAAAGEGSPGGRVRTVHGCLAPNNSRAPVARTDPNARATPDTRTACRARFARPPEHVLPGLHKPIANLQDFVRNVREFLRKRVWIQGITPKFHPHAPTVRHKSDVTRAEGAALIMGAEPEPASGRGGNETASPKLRVRERPVPSPPFGCGRTAWGRPVRGAPSIQFKAVSNMR